ncbi:hypothetical protein BBP40_003336 [Aspergillus hancockii]|nr:hypothetical protein BBP40_003336 [Aspergillus hancockii]
MAASTIGSTRKTGLLTKKPNEQDTLRAPAEEGYPDCGEQGHDSNRTPRQQNDGFLVARKKTWRFWTVFPALCVTTFRLALDTSILSTALPTIVLDIGAGERCMWIINSYILSLTIVLPLFGQTANIFGRRWTMIGSVVIFTVGSGLAGSANNKGLIIRGHTIQDIGGGGINTLVGTVICDLVPLR